jgi:hypothetical protein
MMETVDSSSGFRAITGAQISDKWAQDEEKNSKFLTAVQFLMYCY